MIGQLVAVAASFLGITPAALGLPTTFWCQDFVTHVVVEAGHTGGGWSPPTVLANGVPFEPVPGGIVGINAVPYGQPDFPIHVAVVESVAPDGAVTVIEGNGASDLSKTQVARGTYRKDQIAGSVITPESHDAYLDGLCADLQEAKPWIDWGC